MSSQESTGDGGVSKIRRIARILSIVVILFALFMLISHVFFDDVEAGVEVEIKKYEMLGPIFMFISVFSLGLAWRWELLGGVLNILFFIFFYVSYWAVNNQPLPLRAVPILGLAIVPGILFLVCWNKSRQAPLESA